MKLYSPEHPAFARYGRILRGYDLSNLLEALSTKVSPENNIFYTPSDPDLEASTAFSDLRNRGFGGMPIQIGYVSGKNGTLDCLEYHKGSEFNIPYEDVILVLGCLTDAVGGVFDTSKCEAFLIPAGYCVEVYGTTLHYAPFHTGEKGYRMACVLPKGTNTPGKKITPVDLEDRWYWGTNKWIASLPGTASAEKGVFVGLTGKNISLDMLEK